MVGIVICAWLERGRSRFQPEQDSQSTREQDAEYLSKKCTGQVNFGKTYQNKHQQHKGSRGK